MKRFDYDSISTFVNRFRAANFSDVQKYFLKKSLLDKSIGGIVHESSTSVGSSNCKESGRTLYLITGGIAAGKSTVAYALLPYYGLEHLPYVSSDFFYSAFFTEYGFGLGYNKARQLTDVLLKYYAQNGNSFVWETVLSKEKKRNYLLALKDLGYTIECIYVSSGGNILAKERYILAKERAIKRLEDGYHDVPLEFIADRYRKSLQSVKWLLPLCDDFCVLDNTSELSLIAHKNNKKVYLDEEKINSRLRGHLINYAKDEIY